MQQLTVISDSSPYYVMPIRFPTQPLHRIGTWLLDMILKCTYGDINNPWIWMEIQIKTKFKARLSPSKSATVCSVM